MSTFYFVAGASGSGKTAIMSDLKNILGDSIAVFDFDDIGVPDGADKKWRQKSTERWLQKLLSDGKDACLLGQIVLGEILACPSAKQIDKVNFLLLDVSDFERIQRLKKRNTYGIDQNMLNWSSWLRMHHQDPQWEQHVLIEDCWHELDFSVWDQLLNWNCKALVNSLDTTRLTLNQVAEFIANWINQNNDLNAYLLSHTPYKIIIDYNPSQADNDAVVEGLVVHYERQMGEPRDRELSVFLKNNLGEIFGGLQAHFDAESVYVEVLWVNETLRKKGYGTQLINAAEQEAIKHGCASSITDTWSFQAEEFYLKNGYERMGEIKNYWYEHSRIFLKKAL
ncbi:MAG: GNAT family N-acetyltransferase [Tatlockia sp.]|nr:GNAT family N-acetyltransferase [Tatlockia sp.]